MRRLIAVVALGVAVLVSVVAARTILSGSKQPLAVPVSELQAGDEADVTSVAARLAAAIRIQTVTYEDASRIDVHAFTRLHEMLLDTYPSVHASLRREVVAGQSLLYTWPGQDATLPPIVLTAHLDVVPAANDASEPWTYPPFEGHVEEGYLWGRGAIDDKASVIAIMEAVQGLLHDGFRPQRTIYLAFGHDEERGGYAGAARMARILKARGVAAAFVLDEGLFVTEGIVPGIATPVALVGTAEKGAANVELSVASNGGHASMPPAETALGLLSRAVARLEMNPFPARLDGAVRATFAFLAPEMKLSPRIAFANLWLFGPLVRRRLAGTPSTNALLRTTIAPTIIEGGDKANAMPRHARAVLNVRLLPADDLESVSERIRQTIDDDRVRVRVLDGASEASPVSRVETPHFAVLQHVIRNVFPGVVVAPALMIARTDARHYAILTEHVFRFTPVWVHADDLDRIHGVDERVALSRLTQSVRFYRTLLRAAAGEEDVLSGYLTTTTARLSVAPPAVRR